MQHLELSPEEAEVLRDLLRHCLDEIDVEVVHTDTRNFKQMLKHRRELLDQVLARLPAPPVRA